MKIIPTKKTCQAYRCCNAQPPKDKLCPKHRHRHNKEQNPVRYTYNLLKSNAKYRNKSFTLTFEQFTTICDNSDYMQKKGRKASSLTLDRVINELGYEDGNLAVVTKRDNCIKRNTVDYPRADKDDLPF